tara:strand:+ start:604 stop:804 length:201 start_codon:yes stop_codon:yes gene_type:complete
MAKLRRMVTEVTYIWYEADLTDEQAKAYKEGDEINKWDIIEEVEDDMDFVRDKPISDNVEYELIEE